MKTTILKILHFINIKITIFCVNLLNLRHLRVELFPFTFSTSY
jgi:hypothetical protein